MPNAFSWRPPVALPFGLRSPELPIESPAVWNSCLTLDAEQALLIGFPVSEYASRRDLRRVFRSRFKPVPVTVLSFVIRRAQAGPFKTWPPLPIALVLTFHDQLHCSGGLCCSSRMSGYQDRLGSEPRIGDVVEAVITRIKPQFGLFVELPLPRREFEGLIHLSEVCLPLPYNLCRFVVQISLAL